MRIPFIKMHGAGNDFVVIDNRRGGVPLPRIDMRKLADRQLGIGCDQVIVLQPSDRADVFMRIINSDGSESGSCGNASRCIAWLMHSERHPGDRHPVLIETLPGVIEAKVQDEKHVTLDMGEPVFDWRRIPLSEERDTLHVGLDMEELIDPAAVSMGNPHLVYFVKNVDAVPLGELGPRLERHPLFPKQANISVAQIDGPDKITLRVWERGAGLTLACGTAACATLVSAHRRGLMGRSADIRLPGGMLHIEWRESDNHVLKTGPTATTFRGEFDTEAYKK